MAAEKIKKKSLVNKGLDIRDEIEKVNEHTIESLSPEDVYLFEIELCDNDVDRVGDHMTDHFLEQVAENAAGLPGLKDHDWSSDNQLSRLYDATVAVDPERTTKLGEQRKYVLGKAYTLSKYEDYIEKINAGLLKECSISFESEGDTCSICGKAMIKDENDVGHCENGHVAGTMVDGKLCCNELSNLVDTMEWSLVAVPCQHNAGIKNKSMERSSLMKKAELFMRKFMSSKAYEDDPASTQKGLEEAANDKGEDVSDEDIKALIDENGKLQAKVKELEAKAKDMETASTKQKMEDIVSKKVDEMGPITPKVKDMFMKDIPWDTLKLEDGQIPGLDDVFAGMQKDYDGLFASQEETEEEGGHEEPDGDEAGEVYMKDEPDGDEGKLMVMDKGCGKSKGLKPSSAKSKAQGKATQKSAVQPGIYFGKTTRMM